MPNVLNPEPESITLNTELETIHARACDGAGISSEN